MCPSPLLGSFPHKFKDRSWRSPLVGRAHIHRIIATTTLPGAVCRQFICGFAFKCLVVANVQPHAEGKCNASRDGQGHLPSLPGTVLGISSGCYRLLEQQNACDCCPAGRICDEQNKVPTYVQGHVNNVGGPVDYPGGDGGARRHGTFHDDMKIRECCGYRTLVLVRAPATSRRRRATVLQCYSYPTSTRKKGTSHEQAQAA